MASTVQSGDVIDGRYRVERVLGSGGMGLVVEATHLALGTKAAIKVLRITSEENARNVDDLVREARLAASLRGQHVVRVFDVGLLDAGSPFVVMEHLEGCTLSERLATWGALPVAEAVGITLEVCDAVEEAHALGIIHRDLKPSNVFLVRQPNGTDIAKVLDFGIARLQDAAPSEETAAGAIVGTPVYMAPEHFSRPPVVSKAGDIWAIGVMLYELLAGERPFGGSNLVEIIWRITSLDPPELPSTCGLPPGLREVLWRCLAREPSARFASVSELAAALAPFAPADAPLASRHRPIAPSLAPSSGNGLSLAFSAGPPTSSALPTLHVEPPPQRRGRRWPLAAAIVGACAFFASFGAFAMRHRHVARDAPPTVTSAPVAPPAPPSPPPIVVLRGSSTIGELAVPLGRALDATSATFALRYEPSSSTAGIGALTRGEVELAASSRPASEAELRSAAESGSPLEEHVIARDGIAVIVHPDNPVSALGIDQLRGIFTGRITTWSALGGKGARINVLVRPEEQGSHEVIKSNVFQPGDTYAEGAEVVRKSEDVAERVRHDPLAIGYVTFLATGPTKALRLRGVGRGAKAVPPSAATIRSGTYPLRRDLFVYAKADASAPTREVLAFLLAPGQRVVREAGFVTVEP